MRGGEVMHQKAGRDEILLHVQHALGLFLWLQGIAPWEVSTQDGHVITNQLCQDGGGVGENHNMLKLLAIFAVPAPFLMRCQFCKVLSPMAESRTGINTCHILLCNAYFIIQVCLPL